MNLTDRVDQIVAQAVIENGSVVTLDIDTLVIPRKAFDVAQIQITQPKAPVALVVRQTHRPVSDTDIVRTELGLVAITGFTNA